MAIEKNKIHVGFFGAPSLVLLNVSQIKKNIFGLLFQAFRKKL
jgi:hypothetical protein